MTDYKMGLIVIVHHIDETCTFSYVCDNIHECHKNIIDTIISLLEKVNIDIPLELERFNFLWFNNSCRPNDFCEYYIFNGTEWISPFEIQELYSDSVNEFLKLEKPIEDIESMEFDSD